MAVHQDFNNLQREVTRSALVDHSHAQPNNTIPTRAWSQDQTLHMAVMYSNPRRWRTRRELFNDFRRHIASFPNIKLYVGELAYGERPFEVTSANHPLDFQFRTRDEIWHKENILNLVVSHFPPDWQYGAYCDGDFTFTRKDVDLETIQMLQHHDWVQMYSTYADLGPDHQPLRILKSFAYRWTLGELTDDVLAVAAKGGYYHGKKRSGVGTTGGAWAFRRESFDACGALLDICILGSADWHMAFGLVGEADSHPQVAELTKCGQQYADAIKTWQNRAAKAVKKNVGVVNCHAIHHFHGSKTRRFYGERWKILRDCNYDPRTDLLRDSHGVYQLDAHRIQLRDEIRRYFISRNEDDPTVLKGDDVLSGSM